MKSPKTTWAAVAFFLLTLAVMVWEIRSAQRAQARESAFATEQADILRDIRKLRSSLAGMRREEHQLKEPAAGEKKPEPPTEAEQAAQLQQRRTRILRSWLALRNAALYSKLGLTPEQIGKYEDIVINHYLRMQDINEAAQAEHIPRSDPAIVQLENEENLQYIQQLSQGTDPAMSQAMGTFEKLSPARTLVNSLAGNLYYTDEPLTPQQADQLTQILANNSPHYVGGRHVDMNNLDMATAISQAQAILSPGQLAALNNINQGTASLAQYNKVMQALTQGAQGQAAPPGK